jgi:hypothetical protein
VRKSSTDPVYLEVYIENASNNIVRYIISQNDWNSGWEPVDWNTGSVPSGYSSLEFPVTNIAFGIHENSLVVREGGQVGIGTASPDYRLDVAGDIRLTDNLYLTDDNWVGIGAADERIIFDEAGTIAFMGANVGIGTTSPANELDVAGTIRMTGFQMTTSPSAGYVLTSDGSGVGTWTDVSSSAGPWTLTGDDLYPDSTAYNVAIGAQDAGSAKLYVSGNVGIGTTDPDTKLHIGTGTPNRSPTDLYVTGTAEFDAETHFDSVMRVYNTLDTRSNVFHQGSAGVTLVDDNPLELGGGVSWAGDALLRYETADANALLVTWYMDKTQDANNVPVWVWGDETIAGIDLGSSGIDFSGVSQPRLAIVDDDADSYINIGFYTDDKGIVQVAGAGTDLLLNPDGGNVGIGTTGPGGKLSIADDWDSGDIKAIDFSGFAGTAATGDYWIYGDANNYWQPKNSGTLRTSIYIVQSGGYITTFSGDLDIYAGGSADILLNKSSGNVGIGTTGPSQLLHVAGTMRLEGALYDVNNEAGSSNQILSTTGSGVDWVDIGTIGVGGTGTTGYVPKWIGSSTLGDSVIYDDGTNVGIGTTGPGYLLDINGTAHSSNFEVGTRASTFYSQITGSTFVSGIANGDTLKIGMGNVSVANHIAVDTQFGWGRNQLVLTTFSNFNRDHDHSAQTDPTLYIHSAANPDTVNSRWISFSHTGTSGDAGYGLIETGAGDIILNPSGNVGIGTTGPSDKLEIDGDLRIGNSSVTSRYLKIGTVSSTEHLIETNAGHINIDPGVNSKVGINNSSPEAMLHIVGRQTTDIGLIVKGVSSQTANLQEWQDSAGDALVVVDADGNVGIGTTAPAYKLDVNGNVNIGGTATIGTVPLVADNSQVLTVDSGVVKYIDTSSWDKDYTDDGGEWILAGDGGTPQAIGAGNTATFAGGIGIGTTTGATDTLTINVDESYGFGWTGTHSYSAADLNFTDGTSFTLDVTGDLHLDADGGDILFGDNGSWFGGWNAGNLGIGTTGPSSKLHVKNGEILLEHSTTTDRLVKLYGSADDGRIEIYQNNASTILLNGKGSSYFNGGNVGIGTATPTDKLDVAGGVKIGSSYAGIGTTAPIDGLLVEGNVGIGTTGPVFKLDVDGDIGIASGFDLYIGSIGIGATGSSNTTAGAYLVGTFDEFGNTDSQNVQDVLDDLDQAITDVSAGAGGWSDDGDVVRLTNVADEVGIGTSAPGGKLEVVADATSQIPLIVSGYSDSQTADLFQVRKYSGAMPAFVITSAGNIGIGTTGPSQYLQIGSTSNQRDTFIRMETGNGAQNREFRLGIKYGNTDTSGVNYDFQITDIARTTTPDFLIEWDSGYIGMGTTNPSSKLEVVGEARATRFAFQDDTDTYLDTLSDNKMSFVTAGSDRMVVDSGGNVGIGTTGPVSGSKLDVRGSINVLSGTRYLTIGDSTGDSYERGVIEYDGSNTLDIYGKSNVHLSLGSGGTNDRLWIDKAGNIGIGTTNPSDNLHVYNPSGSIVSIDSGGGNAHLKFRDSGTERWSIYNDSGTDNLHFREDGDSIHIAIQEGGNIGIGTTAPSQKLHIDGNMRLTGALYDVNNQAGSSSQILSTRIGWILLPLG